MFSEMDTLFLYFQAQPLYQDEVSSGDEIGMSSDSDFERPIDGKEIM